MSNNQENVRSSSSMSTAGQVIGRLVTAAIVLAITAFFTPGFSINNIWTLAIAAIVLTLIDYLIDYMSSKGVDTSNKDILITNGFTEGFDIVLSSFTTKGDNIICENPTHNTAIKIMKSHDLNIIGVDMDKDGINLDMLNNKLNNFKNVKIKTIHTML